MWFYIFGFTYYIAMGLGVIFILLAIIDCLFAWKEKNR